MILHWQGSDHVVVSVGISLNCSAAKESPFHRSLFNYDRGDWDNLTDFLHVASWTDIFAKPSEACTGEVTAWISAGINTFIPSRKYHLKLHSSPWFSPACTAALANHNHFFPQFQRDNSAVNKQIFTNARNHCLAVIHDAKSDYKQQIYDHISSHCHITSAKVAAIVARLAPGKATGPDGIPVIVLQKCSPELSSILSRLFQKCISESCFPSLWKFPSVVPVFKNCGDRSNPCIYKTD
ncbi:Hypothetical predicted protein [Octopus vulgaris]|uniref:Uncharacterized protein n=1 Tax=Octopus vulgaris TaxID=6645 RepID=A0AA36BIA7_OCTVU|nr:Hypothetical predicted protein [Octopus vulgaris]